MFQPPDLSRRHLLAMAGGACLLPLAACTAGKVAPDPAGAPDASPDASLEARLAAVLEAVPVEEVPGILLMVDRPDERISLTRGYEDRETRAPIRMESVMRAGSICKTYMAALTVKMAGAGQIDLEAPLSLYVDPAVMAQLPEGLDPTIRQLLNHTSGVPDYYSERFYEEDWDISQRLTPALVLHAIRGLPATQVPGTVYDYSNTNYHLVALVLEAVSGKSVASLLQAELIGPLGLQHTYYDAVFPPGDTIHGYGSPFDPWADMFESRENTGPDGGMMMRPSDLVIWLRALLAPGGRFEDIGRVMAADPVLERKRREHGLGLDIMTSREGTEVLGHTGGVDGYFTAGFYVPVRDSVLVLYMNRSDEEIFGPLFGQCLREVVAD